MNRKVVIFGASGQGKITADNVRMNGLEVFGFIDDDQEKWGKDFFGYRILGDIDVLENADKASIEVVIGVGDNFLRKRVSDELKRRMIAIKTLVHPSASIGKNVQIGEGSVVMANVVINPDSVVGEQCLLNTACTVDHDNRIGDYVHVSPGAHLGGNVRIGSFSWIGLGALVINDISVGQNITVGSGAVVVEDLKDSGVYVGNPARLVRKKDSPS